MKLYCIACEVLARPLYWSAAHSPHIVDIQLIRRGLHNQPAQLRAALQLAVDAASTQGHDYIVMGYGLCGQALAGITARSKPVVIPRAHDCITLFLGSRARYQDQFERFPGTYWYAQDYIERDDGSGGSLAMGADLEANVDQVYAEYIEKYGQDNADYLMEVMGAWKKHYSRAAYIEMGIGGGAAVEAAARDQAARRGWTFERIAGDLVLLRRLLDGDWERDYLVLQPGQKLSMTYNEDVIGCEQEPRI